MSYLKDVRAKCLLDLGHKWQKMIAFKDFTLVSQSESHKIDNIIISVFLN